MKLIIIDHDEKFSGATKSLSNFLKYIDNRKYEIYVASPKTTFDFQIAYSNLAKRYCLQTKIIKYWLIDIHFTSTGKNSSFINKTLNIVKIILFVYESFKIQFKLQPDIWLCNEYVSFPFIIFPKLFFGRKTYSFIRSPISSNPQLFWKIIKYVMFKSVNTMFAITRLEYEKMPTYYLNKIVICNEFVETVNVVSSENRNSILFLGGISELKGTKDFLMALQVLKKREIFVSAKIFGVNYKAIELQNKYENEMVEIINNLKTDMLLECLGTENNMEKLWTDALILVTCNKQSHFSLPIIEAWANNVLVIASDTDHNRSLIQNRINGFLYESGNYLELADVINYVIKINNKKEIMKNGYKIWEKEFNAKVQSEMVINIIGKGYYERN